MLKEDLKDAAIIIQNILHQPIAIPKYSKDVSLIAAALEFEDENEPESLSSLSQVMFTFIEYPEPTETLLRELEIISRDLE